MGSKLIKIILAVWNKIAPIWYSLAKIASAKPTMILVSIFAGFFVIGLITWAAIGGGGTYPLFETFGTIANQQRDLIIFTLALGFFVVLPVFILLFVIVWKYRAGNKNVDKTYDAEYHGNLKLEAIWWGIPGIIIAVLAVITGITTFALDPYKPLDSDKAPVNVQVIALEWKWLFIYPDENVASLQQLVIPEDRPINFMLTSDAPMNSFWIPALAGQIYTMNGMSTKLHLMADQPGDYLGMSANISGEGFADMKFTATVKAQSDFDAWMQNAKLSTSTLGMDEYESMAEPSVNPEVKTYTVTKHDLYNEVVMKYMHDGMEM